MREERRFLAGGPVAIKPIVITDDRFSAAFADDKRFAAAPARHQAPVHEIGRNFSHVTALKKNEVNEDEEGGAKRHCDAELWGSGRIPACTRQMDLLFNPAARPL
jgi:hypothetical protein